MNIILGFCWFLGGTYAKLMVSKNHYKFLFAYKQKCNAWVIDLWAFSMQSDSYAQGGLLSIVIVVCSVQEWYFRMGIHKTDYNN